MVGLRQGHENDALGSADTEGFGPEIAKFFKAHADSGDHPSESPDHVLILAGGPARTGAARRTRARLVCSHSPSSSDSFARQAKLIGDEPDHPGRSALRVAHGRAPKGGAHPSGSPLHKRHIRSQSDS